MIRYTPQDELNKEGYELPFEGKLDPNNRWVKLADELPWDEMAKIYMESLCADDGRPTIDVRLAIGALIIKHRLRLSDREVVDTISENVYIQYFVGLRKFRSEPAFDPSLFVKLRERMGAERFDRMSEVIIRHARQAERQAKAKQVSVVKKKEEQAEEVIAGRSTEEASAPPAEAASEAGQAPANQGYLKLDATVSDQLIVYPTDLNLLARSRWESERLIDILYKKSDVKVKPRTYRRVARGAYLSLVKSRKNRKNKRLLRRAIGQQLRYLRRNLETIDKLLDLFEGQAFPLCRRDQKIYWVIQHIYAQQKEMYDQKKNRCDDRIVSIYQPYVRPIKRGKEKGDTEFGAKLGVSEFDGFSRINHLSWDAYHESADLQMQVESYRALHGYYPEAVLADQIYLTRENRRYLKERGIRHIGVPLGRPKEETPKERKRRRKERGMRSHIEGKFGQGKNAYGLRENRARRQDTSEAWLGGIFLAMNLVNWAKMMGLFLLLIILVGMALFYIFFWSECTSMKERIAKEMTGNKLQELITRRLFSHHKEYTSEPVCCQAA